MQYLILSDLRFDILQLCELCRLFIVHWHRTHRQQYGFVYPVTQFFRSVSLSLPYTPSASLAGVDAVAASSSAWAGADLPLQTNESAAGIKIVPTLIGGTVFVYNLPPLYGSP